MLQKPDFLGIWDPPNHASVPLHKLEEARKEAQKRAGRTTEGVTAAQPQVRTTGRGPDGRRSGARDTDACSETTQHRGEILRVQRAGFEVASPASAVLPRGSDEASTVEVGPSAPAMQEGYLATESTDVASEETSGLLARRVQGAVPADTQRKRFGDLTERRAENEYVDEEMRRRGFVLQAGQWVGGQMLPGEPRDANLAEDYLREKFRQEQAEERAEASQDWGRGRRLGD